MEPKDRNLNQLIASMSENNEVLSIVQEGAVPILLCPKKIIRQLIDFLKKEFSLYIHNTEGKAKLVIKKGEKSLTIMTRDRTACILFLMMIRDHTRDRHRELNFYIEALGVGVFQYGMSDKLNPNGGYRVIICSARTSAIA